MERAFEKVLGLRDVPLADNRVQVALAKFAFVREHPEVKNPSGNDILRAWANEHAAVYREIAEREPQKKVNIDDQTLSVLYDRLRALRNEGPATMH